MNRHRDIFQFQISFNSANTEDSVFCVRNGTAQVVPKEGFGENGEKMPVDDEDDAIKVENFTEVITDRKIIIINDPEITKLLERGFDGVEGRAAPNEFT